MPDPYAKSPGLAKQDKKPVGGGSLSVARDLMGYDARNWRGGVRFNENASLDGSQVRDRRGLGGSANAWLAAQRYAAEKRRKMELLRAKEEAARAREAAIKRMEGARRRLVMTPGEEYDEVLSKRDQNQKDSYGDLLEQRRNELRAGSAAKKRLQGEADEFTKGIGNQSQEQWLRTRNRGMSELKQARDARQSKKAGVKRFEGIANHELPIALNRSIEQLSPGEREYIEAIRQHLDQGLSPAGAAPRQGRGGDDITSDSYWADITVPGGAAGEGQLGDVPGVILIRDPSGKATTETLPNAYRSIIDKVNDATSESTAHAGDLAWSMMHAGYYSEAAKKRLKDRMVIYEDANGRERFRLIWGADDEAALETALEDAAQIGASDVGEGLRTNNIKIRDFEQIVTSKAVLNRQLELGVAMQGGGESRDPAALVPGKFGGVDLDPEQIKNVQTIMDVGSRMGASERDIGVALIAAMQESRLKNVNYGHLDSLGLFQQRANWGSEAQRQDPVYASQKFFDALLKIENRDSMSMGDAAQKVQRSAFPEKYDDHLALAADLIGAKNLGEGAELAMLGAVKPHVKSAAKELSAIWGFDNIGGHATSGHIPGSDHYTGKAIDVMLEGSGKGKGPTVVGYLQRNAKRLGVKDIIHNHKYYKVVGGKWVEEPYHGANPHTGHVHAGFHDRAGGGDAGLMQEIAGGSPLYTGGDDSGGPGGSGGGGGQGGLSSGAASVSYSDEGEIEEAANSIGQQELGRDFDEDEIAELVSQYHGRESEYQQAAASGLSGTTPDITGAVRAFIKKKIEEEQEMFKSGQLAMAAFQLLSGRGELGIG